MIDADVILAAAGPSLETLFPFDREGYFLCAVSSSLSCLLSHGVRPDLCIATDGGFWALNHFRDIPKDIPVAFPCEAAIPNGVLESNPVEFLSYDSEIERSLLGIARIDSEKAARNGTVSGTAALFLLEHAAGNVFAAGLDLCATDSYSHARPHASGPAVEARTERTKPLALALHESNRDTASLDMYAAWFSGRDDSFKRRFFRIGDGGKPLSGIQSVSPRDLSEYTTARDSCGTNGSTGWIHADIPSRLERQERVIEWIDGLRSSLVASITEIPNDPVLTEVLQMISFSGYLRHLREVHGTGETRCATKELRDDALSYLDRLSSIVGRLRLS